MDHKPKSVGSHRHEYIQTESYGFSQNEIIRHIRHEFKFAALRKIYFKYLIFTETQANELIVCALRSYAQQRRWAVI
jgi:hypothetical protein